MTYEVKLTVMMGADSPAAAMTKVQDRLEPTGRPRADNGMYIESVDKVQQKK